MKGFTVALVFLLAAISLPAQEISWEKARMDGSRTGVVSLRGKSVPEALGTVSCGTYHAPNGRVFRSGSTVKVAEALIKAQPGMEYVREVLGHSEKGMNRGGAESQLGTFAAEVIREQTALATGREVHIALINRGGIRLDLPKGDVILDDVLSMFPFRNYLCYVALKGSDVRVFFEHMARRRFMPFTGASLTVRGQEVVSILIGGEPLDDGKVYGFATVDFLLDGGDGVFVARNSLELVQTSLLMSDAVLAHIRTLTAEGKTLDGEKRNNIIYLED